MKIELSQDYKDKIYNKVMERRAKRKKKIIIAFTFCVLLLLIIAISVYL